ncbi:Holliday junction branch migration protein RuvA [candidate division WOR-3 bacterium]|nr:Holliday junction branch migration protein RuvA [candidate division WOR-3 bacterium]
MPGAAAAAPGDGAMIAVLRGTVARRSPTRVVLDCGGIGFELGVPLSTSNRLGAAGSEATLLVVPRFTQTGLEFYGFLDEDERDVFRLLLSVKGIGPKAGLNILSRFSPDEVRQTIAAGRVGVLETVPGIGPKKAERVLRELAERSVPVEAGSPLLADAEKALVSLGLTRREARARLGRIKTGPETTLPELLRLALRERGE